MSDNSSVSTIIRIELIGDQDSARAINRVSTSEKSLKDAVQATNKTFGDQATAAQRSADTQYRASQRATEASKKQQEAIATTTKAMKDQEVQADKTFDKWFANQQKIQNAQTKPSPSPQDGGSSGIDRIDRGLSTVERFAGSLGASGINQAAGVAGDALGAGQALAGVGASLGSILTVAAPVGVAIAGVNYILGKLEERSKQVTTALRENYEQQIKDVQQAAENRQAARTKTAEQNKQDAAELASQIDGYGETLRKLRDKRADVDREYADLGSSFNPLKRKDLGDQGQLLDKQISDLRSQLDLLDDQYQNATQVLPDLIDSEKARNDALEAAAKAQSKIVADLDADAQQYVKDQQLIRTAREGSADALKEQIAGIDDQIQAAKDEVDNLRQISAPTQEVTDKIASLQDNIRTWTTNSAHLRATILPLVEAQERQVIATKKQEEATQAAAKAADEYASNSLKLRDLQQQQSDITEKRARDDARTAQVSSLEAQIAAAKEVEAESDRQTKIIAARQKGAADETAALDKLRDDRKKLNESFMSEELRELRSFQKEQSRADAAHRLERIRSLEDLYDSLSDLAAKGDIAGFISAQKSGIRDLRRSDEDAGIASSQRTEDYAEGVQERAEQRRQKLADLEQGYFEERAARQKNIREQIEQEDAAGKQRILKSAELEKQLQALRDGFAQEDLIRTRREEDERINDQIAAVRKRNAELKDVILKGTEPVLTSAKNFFSGVGDAVSRMYERVRAAATARPTTTRSGGGGTVAMNALGGIYTKPSLVGVAEVPGYADAIIPFRQSDGVLPALQSILSKAGGNRGGGLTINHLEIKAGSVATAQDLELLRSEVLGALDDAAEALGATDVSEGAA